MSDATTAAAPRVGKASSRTRSERKLGWMLAPRR